MLADEAALQAAVALLLLSPHIPLIFMGDEVGSRTPFLYFTDHGPELAQAVRQGRRQEFAAFHDAGGELPDPNDMANFRDSDPWRDAPQAEAWREFYAALLALRARLIVPRLPGALAIHAEAVGEKAVLARWQMGDGRCLTLAANLGRELVAAALPAAEPFYGVAADALAPMTTLAWLMP